MATVPSMRISVANDAPERADGEYVLYWMTAFRRLRWNFALQRAVEWANALRRPLLVFEPLRAGYPWASDRLHRFILDGMEDNEAAARKAGVGYFPYLERVPDEGKGLLAALAARACVVVADDYPDFFLPKMLAAGARQVAVRMERVDANGLVPLRAPGRSFTAARFFRLWLQKNLARHLDAPAADPLAALRVRTRAAVPREVSRRWPAARLRGFDLSALPIDHRVGPAPLRGGSAAARARLEAFLKAGFARYAREGDQPEDGATSGLSPYLHFGHISAHEVFWAIARREGWRIEDLRVRRGGARGWWGMGESAEAFLEQLVTWRELGFNFCANRDDYDRYESLPAWARATLEQHERDERPAIYSRRELEEARTADPLWNAAQNQLVRDGRMANYLRMLWGKKVLEWTRTPREALEILSELNNKYALDGRDPNSYSGILWVFGRYDRPWPERKVFGKVRYMSTASTARKLRVKGYLERYG